MQSQKRGPEYNEKHGHVNYLSGRGLARPLDIPRQQLVIVGLFVVIAAAAGAYASYNFYQDTVGTSQRVQEQVSENLTRDVSYEIPALPTFAALTDEEILQTFADAGLSIYQESDDGESDEEEDESDDDESLFIVKFPGDMDAEEAAALYEEGISSLGAADASLLLNGMWTMEVDRTSGISMVVRYADFASGSLEEAVETAIEVEGFDTEDATEVDTDDSGNTFRTGTMTSGGVTFTWRVSAIALDEIYDVSGLPDDAVYVGIRITG